MKKIISILLIINSFVPFAIQAHDCKLKEFLKRDWIAEKMKKENLSISDLGTLGKSPFYEGGNLITAFVMYFDCIEEDEHRCKYEEIKKYRSKISKRSTYNKDQHSSVRRKFRYEQEWLLKHTNGKAADTMEFDELTQAVSGVDLWSEHLLECEYEKRGDCKRYKDLLNKASQRKEDAIKDFEATAKVKNPFVD